MSSTHALSKKDEHSLPRIPEESGSLPMGPEPDSNQGSIDDDEDDANFLDVDCDCELCNPYKYSNRQLGSEIIALFEFFMSFVLSSACFLAWRDPSIFLDTRNIFKLPCWHCFLSKRYIGEIAQVYIRAVFTATSALFLLYGAKRRLLHYIKLYLNLSVFLWVSHYSYLFCEMVRGHEMYVTFVTLPEVLLRPFIVWTVIEFGSELTYFDYKRRGFDMSALY